MARAIAYIKANVKEQPSLEEIARAQSMSASHFQRLFTEWVGISPKKYLEHLTLAHAKEALVARVGTVNSAIDSGLSGTGRLYDLVLKWEAVTPGEFARNGEGTVFEWGQIDTAFGRAIAVTRNGRLACVEFTDDLENIKTRWPKAKFIHTPAAVEPARMALQNLSGTLNLSFIGTEFQIQVWRALLGIKEGQFTSYGALAHAIKRPKASRAIGTAVGQNPLALLIPCHRVIRADGQLGGYHWGLERKAAIIAYESAKSA